MEKRLSKKSDAYNSLCNVADEYPDAVNSIPKLQMAFTSFKMIVQELVGIHVPDVAEGLGAANSKNVLYSEVTGMLEIELNGLLAYASLSNDVDLEGRLPSSYSALTAGTGQTQIGRFDRVHAEAKVLGDALNDFGVETAIMLSLDEKLPILRKKLTAYRDAIDDRILLREDKAGTFQKADAFLYDVLDRLVKTRVKAFPTFTSAYFRARKLRGLSSNSKSANTDPVPNEVANLNGKNIEMPMPVELNIQMEQVGTNGVGA